MHNQKGFTLVETLFALIILSSALVLLSNSWTGSFLRIKKAQQSFEFAALLERKMNEIEREHRGKSLDAIPEEKEDTFGDEFPEYTWKLTSKKLEFPDLSEMLMSKDGGENTITMTAIKNMTDSISKSIKEVTLTVIHTKNTKSISHSITTYFVDYSKEATASLPSGVIQGGK